jgi:hypothetical protein
MAPYLEKIGLAIPDVVKIKKNKAESFGHLLEPQGTLE